MTGPVISSPGALPVLPRAAGLTDTAPAAGHGAIGGHTVRVGGTPPGAALRHEALAPPDATPMSSPLGSVAERRVGLVSSKSSGRELAHRALPDRDGLQARIGQQPKKDVNFGFFVHHRSTGYKEVQNKLDAYHAAVQKCADGNAAGLNEVGRAAQYQDAQNVDKALKDLEGALKNYEKGSGHSHKAEMGALLKDVQRERAMVSGVLDEIRPDSSGAQPEVGLLDLMACRRADAAVTPHQVKVMQEAGWSATDFTALHAATREPHGLTKADLHYAAAHGYSRATVEAYGAARLPINDATRVAFEVEGEMRPLGKGAVNQVFRGEVRMASGERMVGVFKPEISALGELPDAAASSGIDTERPQWACRNIATSRLDQQLRFNLVPPTGLAVVQGKLGIVMEMAEGISPQVDGNVKMKLAPAQAARLRDDPAMRDTVLREQGFQDGGHVDGDELVVAHAGGARVAMDFDDPGLRRELTKLQWLDGLTGQVDRHAGNYFVSRGPTAGVKVTAIDNDLAFGQKLRAAGDVYSPGGVYKGAQLPGVVDRATCDALKGLTPGTVAVLCEGLLNQNEIEATQRRLADIHTHLNKLEQAGHVIESGAGDAVWASPGVDERLGVNLQDVGPLIEQATKPEVDQAPVRHAKLKKDELAGLLKKGTPPAEAEAGAERFASDMVKQRILRAGARAEDTLSREAAKAGYVARDRMQQALGQFHRNPVLDVTRFSTIATPATVLAQDSSV